MATNTITQFPPLSQKPADWSDEQWITCVLACHTFTSFEAHRVARLALIQQIRAERSAQPVEVK